MPLNKVSDIDRQALGDRAGDNDNTIAGVIALARPTTARPGDVLMREGVVGEQAYTVRAGRAQVFVDGEPVAQLGPGSLIGDSSISGEPAPATVRAITPMQLLALGPQALALLDRSIESRDAR